MTDELYSSFLNMLKISPPHHQFFNWLFTIPATNQLKREIPVHGKSEEIRDGNK